MKMLKNTTRRRRGPAVHAADTVAAAAFAATMAMSFSASAAIWYVAGNGDDVDNDGMSQASSFATIQKAIDSAAKNDTVEIADGTYYITSPLTLDGKDIELKSAAGDPAKVTVDAQGRCICVSNGSTAQTIINSITFQNGYSSAGQYAAGGIYSEGKTLVTNCVVRDCYHETSSGDAYGGGITVRNPASDATSSANSWPEGRRFLSSVVDTLVENCAVACKDDTTDRTARGGGVSLFYQNIVRMTVRDCSVTNNSSGSASTESHTGGGGAYLSGSVCTNCVIDGCKAVNYDSGSVFLGLGGGVYAVGGNATTKRCQIVDSLIINNYAMSAGGGICCYLYVDVIGCTITNNLVGNPKKHGRVQPGGGGIYVNGGGNRIEGCLIADNDATIGNDGGSVFYGGGVSVSGGDGNTIAGCMIRDNLAGVGGAFNLASPSGLVVSNCVISGNACTDQYSVLRGFSNNGTSTGFGTVFADCIIVSNENRRAALASKRSMSYFANDKDSCCIMPFHLRNCYFAGNREMCNSSSGAAFGIRLGSKETSTVQQEGVRPFVIDHCTFVTNMSAGGSTAFIGCEGASGANTRIIGCVFYGNRGTTQVGGIVDSTREVAISNTFCEVANDTFTVTAENGNLSSGALKFRNEAEWDFRPDAGSCLIDRGGAFEEWMGIGGKSNPSRDIGDGRYTTETSGRYGIRLVRSNTNPRRYGVASDMGCFEYWKPYGFQISFR